jgi:hypothetical protein
LAGDTDLSVTRSNLAGWACYNYLPVALAVLLGVATALIATASGLPMDDDGTGDHVHGGLPQVVDGGLAPPPTTVRCSGARPGPAIRRSCG